MERLIEWTVTLAASSGILLVTFIIGQLMTSWLMPPLHKFAVLLQRHFSLTKSNSKVCREHYIIETDLMHDAIARRLAQVAAHVYTDEHFNRYYQQLSSTHLPLVTLFNWTRTIAEDIADAPITLERQKRWREYLDGSRYSSDCEIYPDYIEFDDSERTVLWGAVYFWLWCIGGRCRDESLLSLVEETACPKLYLQPYFELFKNSVPSESDDDIAAGRMMTVNVNSPGNYIGQTLNIDKNGRQDK